MDGIARVAQDSGLTAPTKSLSSLHGLHAITLDNTEGGQRRAELVGNAQGPVCRATALCGGAGHLRRDMRFGSIRVVWICDSLSAHAQFWNHFEPLMPSL
jgi:hypothetical protein